MDERQELMMLRRLAELEAKASRASKPAAIDPTEGMTTFQKTAAGAGKAVNDLWLGAKQLVGQASRQEIEEQRKLDAALMNTTEGKVGNVLGNVGALAGTALIPGANTYVGAGVIGALSGLLQPSTSTKETLANVGIGGAAGPLGILAGRAVGAGYQGVKALAEPFFKSGQDKIAARTLQRFAADPQAAAAAAQAVRPSLTGAQQTLAEATKDIGIAQLQRGLQAADPDGFAVALAGRQQANNAARVAALRSVAGDDAAMAAAVEARNAAAEPLYTAAKTATAKSDNALLNILDRPSASKAWARAQQLAKERGETLVIGKDVPETVSFIGGQSKQVAGAHGHSKTVQLPGLLDAGGNPLTTVTPAQNAQYSGKGLHYLKLAMDDMLDDASGAIGKNEQAAIRGTREQLLGWMDRNLPEYGKARQSYAEMSRPINQMEVGQRILKQYASATDDLAGNPRLRAEALNRALQNEEQLVRQATGFKGGNKLADVMTPEQLQTIRAVADEIGLQAAVDLAGKMPNSLTAQNLASQNVLRQLLGPTGLPQTWAENALLQTLVRPVQFAAKAGEPKVTNRLANALLNPEEAAALLRMANTPTVTERFGRRALPYLPGAGAAVGLEGRRQATSD